MALQVDFGAQPSDGVHCQNDESAGIDIGSAGQSGGR
jgi:hypothetical protein